MKKFTSAYSILFAIPLLAGRLSAPGQETPVMDLMWWAWLLLVGGSILIVSLALVWQIHQVRPPQEEHGEGTGEHPEA